MIFKLSMQQFLIYLKSGLLFLALLVLYRSGVVEGSDSNEFNGRKRLRSREKTFTEIATSKGTDKVSVHNYGWFYDQWLEKIRLDEFTFVEVGFAQGRGAVSWKKFLRNARVVEMEIGCTEENKAKNGWITMTEAYKEFTEAGNIYCMSALDYPKAEQVIASFSLPFKVMVEDGGHSNPEMIMTFFYYFPRMAANGMYFSEDLGVIYADDNYRKHKNFITAVVDPLQDAVQYDTISATKNTGGVLKVFRDIVKQISCAQGICMIQRNDRPVSDEALNFYKTYRLN